MVILAKIETKDRLSLAALANNRKIWLNVRDAMPYPYSLDDADWFINYAQNPEHEYIYGVYYNHVFCGTACIVLQKDVYSHSAEIGYWIGEPFWNQGIGNNVVKQLIEKAFFTLKLKRLFASVYAYNLASKHILQKNGFKQEGYFEKSVLKNGQYVDEYRLGLWNIS